MCPVDRISSAYSKMSTAVFFFNELLHKVIIQTEDKAGSTSHGAHEVSRACGKSGEAYWFGGGKCVGQHKKTADTVGVRFGSSGAQIRSNERP